MVGDPGDHSKALDFISLHLSFLPLISFKSHTFFLIILGNMVYVSYRFFDANNLLLVGKWKSEVGITWILCWLTHDSPIFYINVLKPLGPALSNERENLSTFWRPQEKSEYLQKSLPLGQTSGSLSGLRPSILPATISHMLQLQCRWRGCGWNNE